LEPLFPASFQPSRFSQSAGQIEYCSSSLTNTFHPARVAASLNFVIGGVLAIVSAHRGRPPSNGITLGEERNIIGAMTFIPCPVKPVVDFAVLDSLDVRLGTIQAVEDVPDSKKLLRLTVSFGDHTRSILVGMKQERVNPAEIVGCQALFVVNLPPKRMANFVSEGMLLDIGYADGLTPALAVPERPLPDGTRAG